METIKEDIEVVPFVICISLFVAHFLGNTHRVRRSIKVCKECLILLKNKALQKEQIFVNLIYSRLYKTMLERYLYIGDDTSATECCEKLLGLPHSEHSEGATVGQVCVILGALYERQSKHIQAKGVLENAVGILIENGERECEGRCYELLGSVNRFFGEYATAEEYLQKAIAISRETDDREGEAIAYKTLGDVFHSLSKFVKAEECFNKALVIAKEIGNSKEEALCCEKLGVLFHSLSEHVKAEDYVRKALAIKKKIGDKVGEASSYTNLGMVFTSVDKYVKAERYYEKGLKIVKEIGDRKEEAACYQNLGSMFLSLSEYDKAEEYLQQALVISKEIRDKEGETLCLENLGAMFMFLSKRDKAEEFHKKALVIRNKIGDRKGEASCYVNLGCVFTSVGEYVEAEKYYEKGLEISTEIGDRRKEAFCYQMLGYVFESLGKDVKAEEYYKKELAINKEICHRKGEVTSYLSLGRVSRSLGQYSKAKEHHERALAKSKEIGNITLEFNSHKELAFDMVFEDKIPEALWHLSSCIKKCEYIRCFSKSNDQFKISVLQKHVLPYQFLCFLLISECEDPSQALCVAELGRARGLADLMSTQYSVGKENSLIRTVLSWVNLGRIIKKEKNCICLYISYNVANIYWWILKGNKPSLFRETCVDDSFVGQKEVRNFDDFFGQEPLRKFHVLPQEQCEDRTLYLLNSLPSSHSSEKTCPAVCRRVEEDKEGQQEPKPSLALYYQMIIAPVVDLLEGPEIIIVPDRSMYKIPFAALKNENGKYLSETFRIRIVPSLTTLKLIQDRPSDPCIDADALVVGDPDVSLVIPLPQLPFARKEAEMVSRLLGVQPLIGHQATKLAVLEMMHSASLIHFAAHGDAERGEIALAPVRPVRKILQREDFVLTMSDVAQFQLRSKLVVLSCCHSGRGQIGAEGVVGIARAFLGSGARSVLVALWALEDKATEQFMNRFYEHLIRGESASECLHESMKWMRTHGFSDVRQWAPFMLIGENVTFDFGK